MSNLIREEFQTYLNNTYPHSKIDTEHSIGGQVHIRFELGGDLENGTTERVEQATDRAVTLFNDVFTNHTTAIYVLIYDYKENNAANMETNFVYEQFDVRPHDYYYSEIDKVNTRTITTNRKGNYFFEQHSCTVSIYKLPIERMKFKNILKGIINFEMGFDPYINQTVYFSDPITNKSFHIYDDRGCYVWSDTAEKIREIYLKRNSWIPTYSGFMNGVAAVA